MRTYKQIIAARTSKNLKTVLRKINSLTTCNICFYRFTKSRVAVSCVNEHLTCHLCVKAANKSALNSSTLDTNLRLKCPFCRKKFKFNYPRKSNKARSFMHLASIVKTLINRQKQYQDQLKKRYLTERNRHLETRKKFLTLQKTILEKEAVEKKIISNNSPPSSPDIIILGSSSTSSHLRQSPIEIPTVVDISDNAIPPTAPFIASSSSSSFAASSDELFFPLFSDSCGFVSIDDVLVDVNDVSADINW